MREPSLTHPSAAVFLGDCLDVLAEMPDNSIDAIVTDPPYGLGFMGKEWDDLPPGLPWAQECLRVLKPGGHLLAFGGTRTWHRLAVAVEDAGFEVRDSIAWLYGSGFPKSLDVSKAIDKAGHLSRPRALEFTEWMRSTGVTAAQINKATGTNMGSHYLTDKTQPAVAVAGLFDRLRPLLPEVPEAIERLVAERTGIAWTDYANRPITGAGTSGKTYGMGGLRGVETSSGTFDITAPATPAAQQWAGWGTALKPAFEPIVVARKPLVGTVAANVLAYGVGALNIDGCRVSTSDVLSFGSRHIGTANGIYGTQEPKGEGEQNAAGRWPANVLLDDDAAAELDEQSGNVKTGAVKPYTRATDSDPMFRVGEELTFTQEASSGGASRFFPTFKYQAKAPTRERPTVVAEDGTKIAHPTVKPLALMRWLVRLVTPPGGTVLDTFAGSGATIEAAVEEGFYALGIEREESYLPLIQVRLDRAASPASDGEGAA